MLLRVIEKRPESGKCFSLIFERPKALNYYPAQYLTIKFKKIQREFTIASSPTENFLMITTKFGISPLKKYLANLKPGDFIESDHPAGTYTLDTESPAIIIVGGIGVTPARSMVKYAVDKNLSIPITLIYSNSDEDFIFKKELNSWKKQSASWRTNLTIHYVITSENGRLTAEKLNQLYPIPYTLYPIFYLAGPPNLVDNFENILLKLGVDETNIRTDRFDGY